MLLRDLSTYRKKRDFEKTSEPSGEAKVAPSKRLRFVIQKHAATRLHYDLRLEFEGVFKSWAVTRGPSLDPHDKRLAVEVEDHPLDYGDFEGTIPKGEYGGGTVMVWDRGYWESDDPKRGFTKGDLKFALDGGKLHGSWVLVRMRSDRTGGKRTNWLLIKHRDEFAREGDDILQEDRSVASGRTMDQITQGKGRAPKPFMTARNARGKADAVWHSNRGEAAATRPATKAATKATKVSDMPDFVAPELCTPVDHPPSGEGWVHEVKFDGYRVQMRVEEGEATLKTRKGLDWTDKFGAIAKEASTLPDVMIDGEIVALNSEGVPDFSALQAAISDGKTDRLIFFAFDLLFAEGMDLRRLPLAERKARLKQLLQARPKSKGRCIRYVEHLEADGEAVMESARKLSMEGVVSKKLAAPYRSGRSESWTKAKARPGHEVVLGGYNTTNGKFRSLLAGVHRDDHLVYVGTVGTGFGQDTVKRIMPALKAAASTDSPFSGKRYLSTEWENVKATNRPVLARTVDLMIAVSRMSQDEASAALRSFLWAVPDPQGGTRNRLDFGEARIDLVRLFDELDQFLLNDGENGRRAQAMVAAAFALVHPDNLDTPKSVNDPSRTLAGDVRVIGQTARGRLALYGEAKQKYTPPEWVEQFADEIKAKDPKGTGAYAALVNARATARARRVSVLPNWRDELRRSGVLLSIWDNPADMVRDAVIWSGLELPEAVGRFVELYADHLRHVEVEPATEQEWRERAARFGVVFVGEAQ